MTGHQKRDALFQEAALTLLLGENPYTQSELAAAVNARLGEQEDVRWRAAIRRPDGIARVFRRALKLLLATKNEMRLSRSERVVSCLEDDHFVDVKTVRPEHGIRYEFSITAEGRQHLASLKRPAPHVAPAITRTQLSLEQ